MQMGAYFLRQIVFDEVSKLIIVEASWQFFKELYSPKNLTSNPIKRIRIYIRVSITNKK
jgi:hypothetical protein